MDVRVRDEGHLPLRPLVHVHEISRPGRLLATETFSVTAALVRHPPIDLAFAYRVDGPDRSIVVSGDTARSEELIALARNADVLVHEALYPSSVDRLTAGANHSRRARNHLIRSHTAIEDVGRVASAASVKTLVLSHLVPGDDPEVTDAMLRAGAMAHFSGEVIVGSDLLEI